MKRDVPAKTVMLLSAGLAVLAASAVSGTLSQPIMVDSDSRSAHWTTAFTPVVPLAWDWNADTTRVGLEITGMGGSFATNFTVVTSNYLWRVFASDVPAAEDLYTLTLTLYTNGNAVAEVLTSRLAVVTGAFGATAVNAVSNSPAWSRVKGNVVIPYDASFAEAATNAVSAQLVIAKINGMAQTNVFADTVGYAGWKIVNGGWGYGTFGLSLTFPGTPAESLQATLTRSADGTMIRMR